MGLGKEELNSDLGCGFVPMTISDLLKEISVTDDCKKLSKLNDYVYVLEQEMKKIDAFKRELPVCMLLLGDAIDRLKEEVVLCKRRKGKAMMMEEFIPSGGNSDEDDGPKGSGDLNDKKNWMSSAQLWTTPFPHGNNFDSVRIQDTSILYQKSSNQEGDNGMARKSQLESWNVKNRGGAFVQFKKRYGGAEMEEDDLPGDGLSLSPPMARGRYGDHSSFTAISQASLREQLQQQRQLQLQQRRQQQQQQQQQLQQLQQQSKKQRRSWSPDLHRRFVNALQQLGGALEATPKQIRELMQVVDLTNDEVKSHLQKYRLHVRKMANNSSGASLDLNLDRLRREGRNPQKLKMAQSGSPEGPLHLGGTSKGVSVSLTIGESLEDEEDEKNESNSWKGRARSQ